MQYDINSTILSGIGDIADMTDIDTKHHWQTPISIPRFQTMIHHKLIINCHYIACDWQIVNCRQLILYE